MAEKSDKATQREMAEGYQPQKPSIIYHGEKGHQPAESNLNANNPPKGGSGVPNKPTKS